MAIQVVGGVETETKKMPAGTAKGQQSRVLIVDDDRTIRSFIGMALSLEGYKCARASNGQEAIKKVLEVDPAIIILDLSMPVMDGREFYRWLRDSGRTDLPVILMTAGTDGRKISQELGAQGCLTKPFDLAELQAYMRKYAKGSRRGLSR